MKFLPASFYGGLGSNFGGGELSKPKLNNRLNNI